MSVQIFSLFLIYFHSRMKSSGWGLEVSDDPVRDDPVSRVPRYRLRCVLEMRTELETK